MNQDPQATPADAGQSMAAPGAAQTATEQGSGQIDTAKAKGGEPGAATTASDQTAPPANAKDWTSTLPPALQKAFAGQADPAEVAKIFERGKGLALPTSVDDVNITWPEGVQVDPEFEGRLKKMCVETGMTPAQIQKTVDFAYADTAATQAAQIEAGMKELGTRHQDVKKLQAEAQAGFTWLDREMNGRLAQSMDVGFITNSPVMIEALALLQRRLGEDSPGGSMAAQADKPEDANKFYEKMFPGGK